MPDATILVVDDEPANLMVVTRLLRPRYRVRVVNSGERALAAARSDPRPDLVLLDVMMPHMSGYDVLDALKAEASTAAIPVIFLTALADASDEELGLDRGAVDYVTKPIKPAVLLARVRSQLDAKRARDFLRDENAFLDAEVARRMADNDAIELASIRALAHLAETRDPETGFHIQRTQAYVRTLAERLRDHPRFVHFLTPRNIDLLTKSAPLHDIGKVGIPDSILLKPGALTAEEWAIMKTHAELGATAIERAEADVLRPVPFLAIAKDIAYYHHERWDGSGYPEGRSGDAIPIAARLMALADAFDAITTPRVYKAASSPDVAREAIVRDRGRHFDPDVVDAFDAAFEEFVAIARKYQTEGWSLGLSA